ncbi:MAG: RNA polymerase sigma factor [Parcubacteria group bacterium]|nr:RNA polymerase sigma factor [Parcubacteria group bacterium]
MKTRESLSDEELCLMAQHGNKQAFSELLERYEKRLVSYARKFMNGSADAEDVVQEAFIKSYKNIRSFEASRKFSSWIYRITHNECVNMLKKRGREIMPFFDTDTFFPHPFAKENHEEEYEKKEMGEVLQSSLDRLPLKYRSVLMLYYLEEMSYKEISDILRIPLSTVGVRLKRGKEALQKVFYATEK